MAADWPRRPLVLCLFSLVFLASVADAQIHRRAITLTNVTSEFLMVPIDVPVNPFALTGVGPGGNNLWFVSSDETTVLPHFIEAWGDVTTTLVWVRTPLVMPFSSKTIYMMYGNPSTGAPSFDDTFPLRYILTSGTVELTGHQNHDWFEVKPGATVNVQAGAPLNVFAWRVVIDGTINGLGKGYPPGAGLGLGSGVSGSEGGGGGAGFGGGGGAGGAQALPVAAGGSTYGTASGVDAEMMGSGGGSSFGGSGGSGGGAVTIRGGRVNVNGTIDLRGADGFPGFFGYGGGGGSGGSLLVSCNRMDWGPATARLDGGRGGDTAGGGGGGGRLKVHFGYGMLYDMFFPPTLSVAGGANGFDGADISPQPGSTGTTFYGLYSAVGLPNPWMTVSVGPEEAVVSVETSGPSRSSVGQPIPNPSWQDVSFRIDVARAGRCQVAIVDLQGRIVRDLLDESLAAGAREVSWDLRDGDGRAVPVGLYYAQVDVDGSRWTRRIVVAR